MTQIKLKKTGKFLPKDRKQEEQEDRRRSQEEGRSSINQRSSPNQERKQKKEETSPSITRPKSTKNLVNLFENNISSAEEIQILGGRSRGPIRQDAIQKQPNDWQTQINSSGITKFKAGKQPNLED